MPTYDLRPGWRRHLTPEEEAEVASLDEAIEMHRKLMAPLLAARRHMSKVAAMRQTRAGAQRSHAA